MQAKSFKRSAIALAIAGAFAFGAIGADHISVHTAQAASSAAPAVAQTPTPAVAPANAAVAAALPDFSGLVEKYGPAVVNISVTADGKKVAPHEGDDAANPRRARAVFPWHPAHAAAWPDARSGLGLHRRSPTASS